jgi:hypothetical protein
MAYDFNFNRGWFRWFALIAAGRGADAERALANVKDITAFALTFALFQAESMRKDG